MGGKKPWDDRSLVRNCFRNRGEENDVLIVARVKVYLRIAFTVLLFCANQENIQEEVKKKSHVFSLKSRTSFPPNTTLFFFGTKAPHTGKGLDSY